MAETKISQYKRTAGIKSGVKYNFGLKAVNRCGSGPMSELTGDTVHTSPPGKISLVRTTADEGSCGYLIDWTEPNTGGSPITHYKVEIRGSNKRSFNIRQCGQDPTITQCALSEQLLTN